MLIGATTAFLATLTSVVRDGSPLQFQVSVAAQTPAETIYRDVYNGWKWWHVYCYRCHGVNAVSTGAAPNLTDPNWKLTPPEFLKSVLGGFQEKGMQPWNKLLDKRQIAQIHLYVRARTDKVLPPGRPDEVGPNKGRWVPPAGWPR